MTDEGTDSAAKSAMSANKGKREESLHCTTDRADPHPTLSCDGHSGTQQFTSETNTDSVWVEDDEDQDQYDTLAIGACCRLAAVSAASSHCLRIYH
jgi:hypothetical protein